MASLASRIDLINHLCSRRPAPAYLEIGCRHDECFAEIHAARKVGVDPEWGGTHRMTSDEFFAKHQDRFDVAFIDGLHLAEQVRRDLANTLRCLRGGGVAVLHDCLPDNAWHADPQRARDLIAAGDTGLHDIGEWCGDVWRAFGETGGDPALDVALWPGDHGCGLVIERPSGPLHTPRTFDAYCAWAATAVTRVNTEQEIDAWLESS